jgi:hypothetical protein
VELKDVYGEIAVARTVVNGHNSVLTLLFAVPGVGPNFRDRHGRTPLYWAAAHGNKDTMKALLYEHHCDPSIADNSSRTPLWIATKRSRRAVMDTLQAAGSHVGVSEEDICATHESDGRSNLACDVCRVNIAAADFHFCCTICGNGEWDICAECKDLGMTCMDDTHVPVKRTMRDDEGIWIEVT